MELFDEHYVNVKEKSSGKKPLSLGNSSDASQDEITVKEIISVYSNCPSIRKIKNLCIPENKFDLTYANTSNINEIIKSLNVNKAKGPDDISAKFAKMSTNVIDCHSANIIDKDIFLKKYSEHVKTATIRPIFKQDDRANIKNYRPVNIRPISAWQSHKLRRNISFKIYFRLSQVLFKPCINSLNRKFEKILRSEKICRSCVNGLIKSF